MSKLTLKDVCLKITDGEHNTVIDDINGEYFLLSSKNIKNGQIIINDRDRRVNEDTICALRKRTCMAPGDIAISTIGTIGESAIVPEKIDFEFQRSVGILKPNLEIITSDYLYYYTKTILFKRLVKKQTTGSVQACLFIGGMEKIPIRKISLDEQNAIVSMIKPFDKKIECNYHLINALNEYSQLLFHKWFVDFNFPNENSEPYKDSGGEMIEVEGKTIPKYWKIVMLSDLVTFKNGINYSADNNETPNSKIISVKHLTRNTILNEKMADDVYLNTCISGEYKIKKFDTIIARSASPGESAIALRDLDVYYSGFSIRVRPKEEIWKYITYFNTLILKKMITSHSDGTIIKNITQQSLSSFKVLKPADNIVELFNQQIELILLKIESLKNETETLIEMRDLLINKLIK